MLKRPFCNVPNMCFYGSLAGFLEEGTNNSTFFKIDDNFHKTSKVLFIEAINIFR